jgi:hypothetical protein
MLRRAAFPITTVCRHRPVDTRRSTGMRMDMDMLPIVPHLFTTEIPVHRRHPRTSTAERCRLVISSPLHLPTFGTPHRPIIGAPHHPTFDRLLLLQECTVTESHRLPTSSLAVTKKFFDPRACPKLLVFARFVRNVARRAENTANLVLETSASTKSVANAVPANTCTSVRVNPWVSSVV